MKEKLLSNIIMYEYLSKFRYKFHVHLVIWVLVFYIDTHIFCFITAVMFSYIVSLLATVLLHEKC